ncbi:hypothetical protein AB6813_13210 [bacterium RCC_150]
MISFYNQVASGLRAKNYSERQIFAILEEVRAHVGASGKSPENDFGTASEYTAQFEKKSKTSSFRMVMNIAYGVIFGACGVYFLVRLVWPSLDFGVSIGLWTTIGAFLAVTVVSLIMSYKLPRARPEGRSTP